LPYVGKQEMNNIFIDTPIERYKVNGRTIWVKREDLALPAPAPALAKLRGVSIRLQSIVKQGYTRVGVYDTRISKAGWGVVALVKMLNLPLTVRNYFPLLRIDWWPGIGGISYNKSEQQIRAQELGAILIPIYPAGRTGVCYERARLVELPDGYMMPLGLTCEESVAEIGKIAETIPLQFLAGSLVLSAGSGMTIAGIISTIGSYTNIYGITPGMKPARIWKRILMITGEDYSSLATILSAPGDYYEPDDIETPFPCSRYYDKKAWRWMLKNIKDLSDPILFWNIGV
jgi:hypothetical protein